MFFKKSIFIVVTILSFSATSHCMHDASKKSWYRSTFTPPNETAKEILVSGQILGPHEEPHHMVERIVNTIASAEKNFNTPESSIAEFAQKFGTLIDNGVIILSTPILTNAGRFDKRPLSACVMPPVDLKAGFKKIKQMVDQYHQDGMGTGYNLSEIDNPVAMLKFLNEVAVLGANSQKEQRPVGNMAILNVDSSDIEEFIMAKVGADARGEDWKFNISVNITDAFMQAVEQDTTFILQNERKIEAKKLLDQMGHAAHQCGDPGLISLARLNVDNPTPLVSEYKCTAPCAEVGLAPGETCVFGSINLAKFVKHSSKNPSIDFDELESTIKILTQALDNVLEISIPRYSTTQSKEIMQAKRKIGIGVCGFADMLIALNLSYEQKEAREQLLDILNFINYHSKSTSMELAKTRGSFGAVDTSRYMQESFLMGKYGKLRTPHVTVEQWQKLAQEIKRTKLLRNATTTALPPTGRCALVFGASTSIEPLFSLHTSDGTYPTLARYLEKNYPRDLASLIEEIKKTGRSPQIMNKNRHPFVTATEISPDNHLKMLINSQRAVDESISKTINLPEETTPDEITDIYRRSYAAGLKGISIFRNKSRTIQPKQLSTLLNLAKKIR